MHRALFAIAALLAACESAPSDQIDTADQPLSISVTRDHITGDVFHYAYTVRVGDTANAKLRIHRVVRERAPFWPRPSTGAIMMMHGDFATFITNFAPVLGNPPSSENGIAVWLAQRGIDVWGFDRRYTLALLDGDISDFDAMDLNQDLSDIGTALAFARGVRLVTDASLAKMTLLGFSRGGQLAYAYASHEAGLPAWQRHLEGLVPVDVYLKVSPEDEDLRQLFCTSAFFEYLDLADGFVDSPNIFQINIGKRFLTAPDDISPNPFFPPGSTNREVFFSFAAQTTPFFPASPFYHLAGGVIEGDAATSLRYSPENVIADWFAGSPFTSSLREAADTDSLVCDEAPFPADVPLSRIRIPLFLIAAAGGYGEHAIYTTTLVSSTDVSTLVIRRLPVEQEAEDFGHGDLLYATDAPTLAWQPLLSWLRSH